ncbi:MAG: methionyl-tRNA formyltransferase [Pleurocapsa minor HA4230-MV1]|jgi:methionyl-tRNA formyltransferase|nr:methionyl-tRNA formyltransferase [Pleurocapsa minor HA4230-MV1]
MVKVLLIGLGITTLTALESLISQCQVVGIVRNIAQESEANDPVINLAKKENIPLFNDPSQKAIQSLIVELKPDCVVVSSYNQILPQSLIKLTTFINVHYSPLPQYRGRANVNWAIINDESHVAISIHLISPELDEGNILYQQLIPIEHDDTVATLYEKLNQIQKENLGITIIKALQGNWGIPQNHEQSSYGCTRLPEDGEINWSDSTKKINNLIRALVEPFPGAYTYFKGEKLIVWQAEIVNNAPQYIGRIPGRIINRSPTEGHVDILTGNGVLRLLEVQLFGQEKTQAAKVIKSVKSTLGLQTSELLNRIQSLEKQIFYLQQKNEK